MGPNQRRDQQVKNGQWKKNGTLPLAEGRQTSQAGPVRREQQMLAISRALLSRPSCCCCDETLPWPGAPGSERNFSHHPPHQPGRHHGTPVEQNVKQALKIAQYGYVLETGKIVLSGETKDLLENPRSGNRFWGRKT